ncbi:MAG TPA: TIGR02996 domain-containing protein [Kofleriaceae bacterium]
MDDFDEEAPTPIGSGRGVQPPLELDPDEMRFVDQINASPDDFPLRVVYADWLEQRGDLRKAELVRLMSVSPRENSPEFDRLRELAAPEPDDWIAILTRTSIVGCEQVRARSCSQRWESLASTDRLRVRWCRECDHEVTFCASLDTVVHHSSLMNRVAYSPLLEHEQASACYNGEEEVDVRPLAGRMPEGR